MYVTSEVIFLGLGVARVIEWVKELAALYGTKRWPGRPSKLLMNLLFSGGAAIALSWGWHGQLGTAVICSLGISGVATTAHSVWSTLQATKDVYRMTVRDRIADATTRRRR